MLLEEGKSCSFWFAQGLAGEVTSQSCNTAATERESGRNWLQKVRLGTDLGSPGYSVCWTGVQCGVTRDSSCSLQD